MGAPGVETVRASVLSPELDLQLLVGNCIGALMLIEAGTRTPRVVAAVEATAQRLRDGAEDLGGGARTVAQTASAVGVIHAVRLAALTDDASTTGTSLRELADALDAAVTDPTGISDLVQQLAKIHAVLSSVTGPSPDEVRGPTRLW